MGGRGSGWVKKWEGKFRGLVECPDCRQYVYGRENVMYDIKETWDELDDAWVVHPHQPGDHNEKATQERWIKQFGWGKGVGG